MPYGPKKILFALPPGMLAEIDRIATLEHRTRSDLIREALRQYAKQFKQSFMKGEVLINESIAGNTDDLVSPDQSGDGEHFG